MVGKHCESGDVVSYAGLFNGRLAIFWRFGDRRHVLGPNYNFLTSPAGTCDLRVSLRDAIVVARGGYAGAGYGLLDI